MAFREVRVFEERDVLRLWLRGEGSRGTERLSNLVRKTVRRYVETAIGLGLSAEGGEQQLTDAFLAPHGPSLPPGASRRRPQSSLDTIPLGRHMRGAIRVRGPSL
jgi:hypothetical protein